MAIRCDCPSFVVPCSRCIAHDQECGIELSDYIPVDLRVRVRAHFSQFCDYCRSSEALTVVTFEVEHILPLTLGGPTEFENLALACPNCNRLKSNRVVGITDEGLESRLFHPQSDPWLDHFDWSISGIVMVGLTDVGSRREA